MVDTPEATQTTLAYTDNDIAYESPEELNEHPANDEIYQNDELGEDFVESVEKNGVLEPLVITNGKKVISGHRRRRAAKQVGLDSIPCRYVEFEEEEDEILALIDFNRQRDKTKGEKVREGRMYFKSRQKRNKEKKEEAGREYGVGETKNDEKVSPHGEKANNSDSYKEAAETVGVSKNSLNRGMNVLETAESESEDEDVKEVAEAEMEKLDENEQSYRGASENVEAARELRGLADDEDDLVSDIAEEHLQRVKNGDREARRSIKEARKQIEKKKHEREIENQDPSLNSETDFDVIVADPPWDYNNDEWRETKQGTVPYPTLSLDELKDIDIPAGDDCILWLWFTNAFVQEAAELVDAWGFEQKTILTWDKDWLGLGHWLQNQTEHAMLCVRGSPAEDMAGESTVLRCQRESRDHSKKPEEFYELVERTCPGSKLELFAREARDGWVGFGDEVESGVGAEDSQPAVVGGDD